jgi:transposase
MRTRNTIDSNAADRTRLETIAADRNTPQKRVWRSRIVLLTAAGLNTTEIMRQAGVAKTCVWRWQERSIQRGVDGCCATRRARRAYPPPDAGVVASIVARTLEEPPGEVTHRTAPAMATGVSVSSVQRIWRRHGLQPHRIRRFKLSSDKHFAEKLRDVIGLEACPRAGRRPDPWVDPPAHAVVLSFDEKSQIQALDRTQPGLPLKMGRRGTMTHDYKRNDTTTLFAVLNVLDGSVIGQCMQKHRHQEFIRFLNRIEAKVPVGKIVHVILDNYPAHKHPKVVEWLARHPRFVLHFTPTSASWLNTVEGFFAILSKRRLKRGVFRSITDLQAAINRYLAEHNRDPKPFTWTRDPEKIIAAVRRGHQAPDSVG